MNIKRKNKLICIVYLIIIFILLSSCNTANNKSVMRFSFEESDILKNVSWHNFTDEYLELMRTKYNLDEIVLGCTNDFEKVKAITKWVSNLWIHDGNNQPKMSDPIYILEQVIQNGERYRCVEYSIVIFGCLNALGIPTRILGIKTSDVETREYGAGHVVTESYLKELDKWILVDGQYGIIPTLNKTPLNAVEYSDAIDSEKKLKLIILGEKYKEMADNIYNEWIHEYLYYYDTTYYKNPNKADGMGTTVMLTPIDATKPKIFQKNYPLYIDFYTTSINTFYPSID